MAATLHEVDIALLLWLGRPACGSLEEFAAPAQMTPGRIRASLVRLQKGGLYSAEVDRVLTGPAMEFLLHGVRFCFPGRVDRSRVVAGIATAWSADPLAEHILGGADPVVWERGNGPSRGAPVVPVHPSVPDLALASPAFHVRAALLDAIRLGRVRDRFEASRLLAEGLAA